jgi:hypothetical protein
VVVGDGELGGFVDAAAIFGACRLQNCSDAVHPFDEVDDFSSLKRLMPIEVSSAARIGPTAATHVEA